MKGEGTVEITIYEDDKGSPKVQLKAKVLSRPEYVAKAYKAIKKELNKEEE